MQNHTKSDFMLCQRKAKKIVEFYEFSARGEMRAVLLKTQQYEFLLWLKEPKKLMKLKYINIITLEQTIFEKAYDFAVVDYKNSTMYFCGQKLLKNHRNAFHEHRKKRF